MRHPHEPAFAPANPLAVLLTPCAGQRPILFPVITLR